MNIKQVEASTGRGSSGGFHRSLWDRILKQITSAGIKLLAEIDLLVQA